MTNQLLSNVLAASEDFQRYCAAPWRHANAKRYSRGRMVQVFVKILKDLRASGFTVSQSVLKNGNMAIVIHRDLGMSTEFRLEVQEWQSNALVNRLVFEGQRQFGELEKFARFGDE